MSRSGRSFFALQPRAGDRVQSRSLSGPVAQVAGIVLISAALFALVAVYASGLRDPRYVDGWALAAGMGLQLVFHAGIKGGFFSPKSAARWRAFHIFMGYLIVAAFISHSDFSLPDTAFEWALWMGFVLVALSGIVGTYIAWSLKTKSRIDQSVTFDAIPGLRAALARDVRAIAETADRSSVAVGLPAPPQAAWITEFYADHLREFFERDHNVAGHLAGSQRHLDRLIAEIDNLSRFVDAAGKEKLAAIKELVIEKDRLDFARVYLGLNRGWLYVHVPVTYGLIVLTLAHILVVYSFTSGAW